MTVSAQDQQQARHRATGGRGFGPPPGHDPHPSGPLPDAVSPGYTPPDRRGGRHRAPEASAAPPNEFAAVPMQRPVGPDSPPSGFRRVPGSFPTTSGAAPVAPPVPGVPAPRAPGAVSSGAASSGGAMSGGAASGAPASGTRDRPFNAAATPTPTARPERSAPSAATPAPRAASSTTPAPGTRADSSSVAPWTPTGAPSTAASPASAAASVDEPITVPVRRRDLDAAVPRMRAAAEPVAEPDVAAPSLRPLAVRPADSRAVRPGTFGSGTYGSAYTDSVASRRVPGRTPAPWTDPTAAGRTRWGLAGIVVGLIGVVLGLAPSTGLLPRVLPQTALGTVPVFSLAGALLGVVAIGLGAVGMFRAEGVGRPLLFGVLGTCAGAVAVLAGLVV